MSHLNGKPVYFLEDSGKAQAVSGFLLGLCKIYVRSGMQSIGKIRCSSCSTWTVTQNLIGEIRN